MIMVAAMAALAALAASPAQWAIYGYAVLLGVGYSATASLIPAMVSDRFSGRHFGTIVGVGLMGAPPAAPRPVDGRVSIRSQRKLHACVRGGGGLRRPRGRRRVAGADASVAGVMRVRGR